MRIEFEMPCFTEIGLQKVETHVMTCAVEIEPDEEAGDGTYYIARVALEGQVRGDRLRFHAVSERNPLHAVIATYAYTYCHDELEDLWADWLADHPRERRLSGNDELRTHGGSL